MKDIGFSQHCLGNFHRGENVSLFAYLMARHAHPKIRNDRYHGDILKPSSSLTGDLSRPHLRISKCRNRGSGRPHRLEL